MRRAAAVVIEGVAELPDAVRAELHQVTEQQNADASWGAGKKRVSRPKRA